MELNEENKIRDFILNKYGFDVSQPDFPNLLSLNLPENTTNQLLKYLLDFKFWTENDIEAFFKTENSVESDSLYVQLIMGIVKNKVDKVKSIWEEYREKLIAGFNDIEQQILEASEVTILIQMCYELKRNQIISFLLGKYSETIINLYRLRSQGNERFVFYIAETGNFELLQECLRVKNLNYVTSKPVTAEEEELNTCYEKDEGIFKSCLIGYENAQKIGMVK